MRHASQLYRGLAEATRSLERPYIPRHVPLPSSSYSAVAQSSVTTPPPNLSTLEKDSARAAQPQSSRTDPSHDAVAQSRLSGAQQAALHQRQVRQGQPAPSIVLDDSPSISRQQQSIARKPGRQLQQGHPRERQPSRTSKSETSPISISRPHPDRTPAKQKHPKSSDSPSGLEAVMSAYPDLSELQADLLLRTFHQIKTLPSHAPSAVVAWYEDFVWTCERESQGAESIETTESLSLLLRHAYQRNDLRSLLRLEGRAARTTAFDKQSRASVTIPATMPKELTDIRMDGISLWPDPEENPRILAYNLKVAFAARQDDWKQVEELLNDARLAKTSSKKAGQNLSASTRSASALNAIGWGSLLRFGLGNARKVQIEHAGMTSPGESRLHAAADPSSGSSDSASSLSEEIEAERIRKAMDDKAQMQAKLAVTKRLLPALLRYTNGANNAASSSDARGSDADALQPKTPAWLLQSVLTQLADRGDAASIIRIVQLALLEDSPAVRNDPARSGGQSTHILNLALTACERNQKVNLAETLRIFNSLTGSKLGQSISGPAVLTRPTVTNAGQRERHSEPQPSASRKDSTDAESDLQRSERWMTPNEESLVLVLKKVQHPLFRAAWTRKLVKEFERFFPTVKLSGRTFRMIVDKCIAPAAQSTSSSEPGVSTSAEASPERIAATGRRGRRLRHAATAPLPTSHTVTPAPRKPAIKQSILLHTLDDILTRFSATRLHLSTTNRRRFEHTLLRAKRTLQLKKALHQTQLAVPTANAAGAHTHHTRALAQLDTLLDRIAAVQRLGRCQDAHRKKRAKASSM
ncbi:uncharacterized protein SRS1_12745 [Sporisorium reilianum f. sp. reilianum]|uniref:Uncharacterized protein n=1 Tax=Sporisorium reilianum f. sp. reilianum TaxID=72559 RepID=A0A2N8UAD5_9BASI|nr:uncharacterized protein SRS1_12745 [Sporisorium reilianum f. sp. reilianum]